jgi:competence protein ComGC
MDKGIQERQRQEMLIDRLVLVLCILLFWSIRRLFLIMVVAATKIEVTVQERGCVSAIDR